MGKALFGTTIPDARDVPYSNTVSGLVAVQTQAAIDEIAALVSSASKAFTFASYGGNANVGRFIELFPGINTDEAPLRVVGALKILAIVCSTTDANATCGIGFYNDTTLLYTLTFTAQKTVTVTGTPASPVFTLPASGLLKIKVLSGSIGKPHLYFTGQGG